MRERSRLSSVLTKVGSDVTYLQQLYRTLRSELSNAYVRTYKYEKDIDCHV